MPDMLQSWSTLWVPAVQDRLALLLNHVVGREPVARERLGGISGRAVVLRLAGWPALLPAAPDLVLGVTPAGMFERLEAAPADALRIEIDASNPLQLGLAALSGERPRVSVQGDATVAGELNWLIDNLRWDIEDDLAALIGPLPARQLTTVAQVARESIAALAKTVASFRPGGQSA
jgi:ubiquinone biosynthesis accessory factor UbiJ